MRAFYGYFTRPSGLRVSALRRLNITLRIWPYEVGVIIYQISPVQLGLAIDTFHFSISIGGVDTYHFQYV